MMKNYGLGAAVVAVIAGGFVLGTAFGGVPGQNERVLSRDVAFGQVRVWTDPETGCEYLRSGQRLTPRLDVAGAPICGNRAAN
jgi:hypothetical protein